MSVPDQTPIVQFTANGNTDTFPFNFYVLQPGDIQVLVGGVLKTLNTHYTLNGVGTAQGGDVTFTTGNRPAKDAIVVIKRSTPVSRTANYTYLGDLQASDLNADLDRLWLALQEQRANFGASISRPAGGVGDWDAQNYAISRVKAGTQPLDAVNYSQLFTVQGNANDAAKAAATSANAAANSASAAASSKQTAADAATAASGSASSAATDAGWSRAWASRAEDQPVAEGLYSSYHYSRKAGASAAAGATSEANAAASMQAASGFAQTASVGASTATQQADRAKTEADKLGNMNALAAAIQSVTGNNVVWKGTQTVGQEGASDFDLVTLRQLRAATAGSGGSAALINGVLGNAIGAVEWFNGTRAKLWASYQPGDGQLLNRADYPELWAAIAAGIFNSVSDALWLNSGNSDMPYSNRGMYSTGDGSTTFRMPDLNGSQSGSLQAPVMRGLPTAYSVNAGSMRDSALPNITGVFALSGSAGAVSTQNAATSGGFTFGSQGKAAGIALNTNYPSRDLLLDASRSNAIYGRDGGEEVRPRSVFGIWVVRVNGSFTAANTNFSVLNGAASAPAAGTVVYGGDIVSKYQVAGADWAAARLRVKATGSNKQLALGLADGNANTEWLMPSDAGTVAVIVASGSTVNGNYVKYSDGTLICSFKARDKAVNATARTEGSVSFYTSLDLWTFPVPFVDNNYTVTGTVMLLSPNGTSAAINTSTVVTNNSAADCYMRYNAYIQFNKITEAGAIAIGRWK